MTQPPRPIVTKLQAGMAVRRRALRRVHSRLIVWGLLSCMVVMCVACKAQLVPLQIGDVPRWFVRLAIVTGGDMGVTAGLAAALWATGHWASGRVGMWRLWRVSAGAICVAVGVVCVLSTNGFRCVKEMPTLSFWIDACRGGPAAAQVAENMTPFLLAWLLIALVGAVAAPSMARWFVLLRHDSRRGGWLLAGCLALLLGQAGASWHYLARARPNGDLWYREIAVNPHWKLLLSAAGQCANPN